VEFLFQNLSWLIKKAFRMAEEEIGLLSELFYSWGRFVSQAIEPQSACEDWKTTRDLNDFQNSGEIYSSFVENYMPSFVRRHLKNESTIEELPHFMDCMLTLMKFRKITETKSLDIFLFIIFPSCRCAIINGLNSELRHGIIFGSAFRCFALIKTTQPWS